MPTVPISFESLGFFFSGEDVMSLLAGVATWVGALILAAVAIPVCRSLIRHLSRGAE